MSHIKDVDPVTNVTAGVGGVPKGSFNTPAVTNGKTTVPLKPSKTGGAGVKQGPKKTQNFKSPSDIRSEEVRKYEPSKVNSGFRYRALDSHGVAIGYISQPLRVHVNQIVDDFMLERYPPPFYQLCSGGHADVPHPNLNLDRAMAEASAFKILKKASMSTIDIGGSMSRHLREHRVTYGTHWTEKNPAVWSCEPIVVPVDVKRHNMGKQLANTCKHRAQECDHIQNFDTAMWVHSHYYFTKEEAAAVIMKTRKRIGYIVAHHFRQLEGNMYYNKETKKAEATWSYGPGGIVMTVDGNETPYVHPSGDWINEQVFIIEGVQFVVNRIQTYGESSLHRMEVFQDHILPKPFPICGALTHVGSVGTTTLDISEESLNVLGGDTVELEAVERIALVSFKNVMLAPQHIIFGYMTKKPYQVPKSLFARARTEITLKKRDALSFKALRQKVQSMTKDMVRDGSLSVLEEADAVTGATIGAFLEGADEEASLMAPLVRKTKTMSYINSLLDFERPHWFVMPSLTGVRDSFVAASPIAKFCMTLPVIAGVALIPAAIPLLVLKAAVTTTVVGAKVLGVPILASAGITAAATTCGGQSQEVPEEKKEAPEAPTLVALLPPDHISVCESGVSLDEENKYDISESGSEPPTEELEDNTVVPADLDDDIVVLSKRPVADLDFEDCAKLDPLPHESEGEGYLWKPVSSKGKCVYEKPQFFNHGSHGTERPPLAEYHEQILHNSCTWLGESALSTQSGPLQYVPCITCDLKALPLPEGVKLRDKVKFQDKDSGLYTLIGPGLTYVVPEVDASNKVNEGLALANRHLQSIEVTVEVQETWDIVRKLAVPMVTRFIKRRYEKNNLANWLETQKTDMAKHRLYSEYIEGSRIMPDHMNRKEHHISFFTKKELLLRRVGHRHKQKAPRGIQGMMNPAANIFAGPFFQSVSKALAYEFLAVDINSEDRDWPIWGYTSGATNERIGQWMFDHSVEEGWWLAEDDFSCFDSTQSVAALKVEHAVYDQLNPSNSAEATYLHQLKTVGYGRFHSYSVRGTRKSGSQNTSVGNTILNFLIHYTAHLVYNETQGVEYRMHMIGLGDDNVAAVKGPADKAEVLRYWKFIEEFITKSGLKPEMLVRDRTTDVTYCSSRFVPVSRNGKDTLLLISDPVRFMAKFGWSHQKETLGEKCVKARLRGNVLGNPNLNIMPVARVYSAWYGGQSKWGSKAKFADNFVRNLTSRNCEPNAQTMGWFCDAFNLTEPEVYELESFIWHHLEETGGQSSYLHHILLEKMVDAAM